MLKIKKDIIGTPILINNSVVFGAKPIGSEEFVNWMVEDLEKAKP